MSPVLIAAMHLVLAVNADTSYANAYRSSLETGRPLVVLVGAEWCPACRTMKTQVLPVLEKRGELKRVAFAQVDYDAEGDLARELTKGGAIPQLLMFEHNGRDWKVRRLIGMQPVEKVTRFLREGLNADNDRTAGDDTDHTSSIASRARSLPK
ncbi:MAG: thioredoxin [Planctomycetota bacterium]|nr:MAG: thioredoxin [Planctomycetota bacterium]